jgi:hypothetical protein
MHNNSTTLLSHNIEMCNLSITPHSIIRCLNTTHHEEIKVDIEVEDEVEEDLEVEEVQ